MAPIVTYGSRFHQYTYNEGFKYGPGHSDRYYSMAMINHCFLSRHFYDIYNSDIFEIQEMRKFIRARNNCDDIGLNYMVSYFYPQLKPIFITGDLQDTNPPGGQSSMGNHHAFRNECIKNFTDILGVNPLRYLPR